MTQYCVHSSGMPSTRQQALSRYVKLFRSLLSSPSKEVAIIARVIGQNASTNTGKNLLNISLETNLSTWSSPLSIVNYLMWLILLCNDAIVPKIVYNKNIF